VVSLGHSAGGHLAFWLAARSRIPLGTELYAKDPLALRAAVSLAGVIDLRRGHQQSLGNGAVRDLLGGTPDTHSDRYAAGSPADLLPLGVRQILLHGAADSIVPIDMSRLYRDTAVARGDKVELIELERAGHFELVAPERPEGQRVVKAVASLEQ